MSPPSLRRLTATRLRRTAERLEPRRQIISRRPSAPLVRFDGRWWNRDELVAPQPQIEPLMAGAPPATFLALLAFAWLQRAAGAVLARARDR